jgi:hypothetical protein
VLAIRITKRKDGGGVLRCVRADASETWQKQESRHAAFFALHDLTHFAVESALGYRRGFYGLIAEGWDVDDTTGKGAKGPLPDEAVEVEYLAGSFDRERAGGSLWTADEFKRVRGDLRFVLRTASAASAHRRGPVAYQRTAGKAVCEMVCAQPRSGVRTPVLIPGTSTTRTPSPGWSTASASAVTICAKVTNPNRRADSRVLGNISMSQYTGLIAMGHQWPGPSTYQGLRMVALRPAERIRDSPSLRTAI